MSYDYELVISPEGSASLTMGGELMWSGDDDDEFIEHFDDEIVTSENEDDVIDWLVNNGYLPPDSPITIVTEGDDDEA